VQDLLWARFAVQVAFVTVAVWLVWSTWKERT
jgi:hypothetical protein